MWRTIVSPIPSPPCDRVLLLSACRNRSKTCGRNCRVDPLAGVGHLQTQTCPSERGRAAPRRARRRGELDGVGEQVPDDLLEAVGVADRWIAGAVAATFQMQLSPLLFGVGAHRVDGGVDDRRRATAAGTLSRSLPVVMRETSSMSSISLACALALRSMTSRPCATSSFARCSACAAAASSRGSR